MRKLHILVLLSIVSCGFAPASQAQQAAGESGRRIVRKAPATYPEVAKRMNLSGTVKVAAVVSPDGTVKSVEAVGGSPVLIQAAQTAIYKWKFAPAGAQSREIIELHFDPQ
jgi:TonB family protein